jgi:phage-related protein
MMTLFDKNKPSAVPEVMLLRQEGLTDNIIADELFKKGYSQQEVNAALDHADNPVDSMQQAADIPPPVDNDMGNVYERMEEITESMIDEKWDDLISEVRKIVEWKEKIEEKQTKIISDLQKLKEDFTTLHGGVLGKLEDYDTRMQDVGTELKAVGKVFKDVVPTFVQNVKDLGRMTGNMKKK